MGLIGGSRRALYLTFLLGVGYTVWLVANIPDQVFFSGDAGVKALLTEQISRGVFGTRLTLAAGDAVSKAWDQGLYPLRPPFVYPSEGGPTVAFPFLFEYMSAPFYRWFGFPGLYVVPLLSIWAMWAMFSSTLGRMNLPYRARVAGLAALIFASHATLYAATFWEHTLGMLLAYFGIDYAATRDHDSWSTGRAFLYGAALGSAFLVRSEALLLALALCAYVMYARPSRRSTSASSFVIGAVAATAVAMAINWAVYRHPLGAHSRQMLEELSLGHRLRMVADHGVRLAGNLGLHFPVVAFVIAFLALDRRWLKDPKGPYGWAVPGAFFLVCLPFIVPNAGGKQLGPRYTLMAIPALALLTSMALAEVQGWGAPRRRAFLALYAVGFAIGLLKNTVVNVDTLVDDYRGRVLPALNFVRTHPSRLVVVNDTCVAQELEASFSSKSYLLALGAEDMDLALTVARASGDNPVLYGSFVDGPTPDLVLPADAVAEDRGRFGGFRFFDIEGRGPADAKAEK